MSTVTTGSTASRLAAVALLVLTLGASLSVTALPVWMLNSRYQSEVDDLHQRQTRYESIRDKDAELRRYLASLQRAQASSGHLLRSDTLMVAAAEMQAALEKIADSNNTPLLSTNILESDDDQEDGLQRVALSVRSRGTLPDLVESIHAIEASPTLFFVEDLMMKLASTRRIRGQEPQTIFEATFTLVGYMAELQ